MKKSHIVVPGPVFGRTKKQTLLAPHSGTFNWVEGVKTICRPSYSPNMATVDIFLFQIGKVELGRPLAVPQWPHDEFGGVAWTSSKKSLLSPFGGRWAPMKSISEIGAEEALKSPEIAEFLKDLYWSVVARGYTYEYLDIKYLAKNGRTEPGFWTRPLMEAI